MSLELQANGLLKTRGTRKVLRGVSFSLQAGQHMVVFGSNGAGKTTLLRLLALLDRPNGGEVRLLEDGNRLDAESARARIGFVTHSPMLYLDLSAQENLMLYARLYGVPNAQERVSCLLEAVGLTHRRADAVRGFSRGMTQRMAIARALLSDPDVLLLDEVYSGLDPRGAGIVRDVLRADASRRITVEVSHDFEGGYGDCTDVLFLERGRSEGAMPRSSATRQQMHERFRQVLQGVPA